VLNNLYALDLGTTKFCLGTINIEKSSDSFTPSIDIISTPALGMYRGMLSDFTQASKALNKLLDFAEEKYKTRITATVVGIAGSHLESKSFTIYHSEKQPTIFGPNTLTQLEKMLCEQFSNNSKEILHKIPLSFNLDNRLVTKTPFGFHYLNISAEYLIISADKLYITDVIRLCNSCGLEVSRLCAEPYASSAVILNHEEKNIGTAVVDIGGGTSDGIIYYNETPKKVFTVDIGGNLMTNDLAIGLGLPFAEAENLKHRYGLCSIDPSKKIELINSLSKKETHELSTIHNILGARIKELGKYIYSALQKENVPLKGGLVFTGGGSQVQGLNIFFNSYFPYKSKTTNPKFPSIIKDLYENSYTSTDKAPPPYSTIYATVIGLLYLEVLQQEKLNKIETSYSISNYFRRFVGWIKEIT